jgi:hypothetical protein
LSDDTDSVGRPLAIELTLYFHRRAAASPLLSTRVTWRIRGVEKAGDPGYVAPEFHVPINNLGLDLGGKHHCRSPAEYFPAVFGEEHNLGVQGGIAVFVVDDVTNRCGCGRRRIRPGL